LIERLQLGSVNRVHSIISEIDGLGMAVVQMSLGLNSFRKYLPGDVVQTLMDQGVVAELGGERRTLTILFMDLEGFTTLSERMGHRMVPFLGDYLSAMSNNIMRNAGTIDKYIGDAVMAFWGAPHYNENHATDACRAALDCSRAMEAMRAEWARQGHPELRVRIGLNTGRVVVGNIGSNERLNYTVLGDPVNLASRLEGMNKTLGTEILISQNTYELAKYDIIARRMDFVTVKGRDEAVAVYELLGMRTEQGGMEGFEWIAGFEKGLAFYREHRWHEAIQQFRKTIDTRGADRPSAVFIARCEEHIAAEGRQLAPPKAAAE
jgi:adenylate cyclase